MKQNTIDDLYDLFDEACMLLYHAKKYPYIEALVQVQEHLHDGIDVTIFDEDIALQLQNIYTKIMDFDVSTKDEIRLVIQLLTIKGLKHANYSLDIVTPELIGLMMGKIIEKIMPNRKPIILDTSLKAGNLIYTIDSVVQSAEPVYIGIENDGRLVELTMATSKILNIPITILMQDSIQPTGYQVDIVVGELNSTANEQDSTLELAQAGVRYQPYLLLEQRLKELKTGGYFIYLISNDFFTIKEKDIMKRYIEEHGSFVGLILLPDSMVKKGQIGKSILIGRKQMSQDSEMMMIPIRDFNKDTLKEAMKNLDRLIEKI